MRRGPVVLVASQLAIGGAERYVVSLAKALNQQGWPCRVVSSGGSLAPELVVPHHRAPVHRRDPMSASAAAITVLRCRPALVHANSVNAAMAGQLARRLTSAPVLLTAHGWPGRDPRDVVPWIARLCDHVVAVSQSVAEWLDAGGLARDRFQVVPNGVDTGRFRPSADPLVTRRATGLEGGPALLYAGRLEPEKGLDVLLAAWPMIREALPNAGLNVAGAGTLASLARNVAGVHLLGPRSDMPEVLAGADLLILPSRSEGLPMVLLEALASGLPVVASRVGGIPEVLTADAGELVPPEDPVALATAVVRVATSGALPSMRAAARRLIEQSWTIVQMTAQLTGVYASLGVEVPQRHD